MGIWSKKEEDDESNKKEENRLPTAISPAIVGNIFFQGVEKNKVDKVGVVMNNEK